MFTVIIPYYKKREYIERCLHSVLNQTYKNYEIILIDDGSEDDIKNLISTKYRESVQFVEQTNQGVSVARNRGIEMTKTPYVHFLDADDALHPQFFEFVHQVIQENKSFKIIGAHYSRDKNILNKSYGKLEYRDIKDYFKIAIRNSLFITSASVINMDFFKENSAFNPRLKKGQDIEVWFRILESEGKAFYIENTLLYYSDEDENQATKRKIDINNRFISSINSLYFDNGKKIYSQDFYNFLSKYMYSSLYIIFFQKETHHQAKELKDSISEKYFFAELYYYIPYKIGSFFLNKRKIQKLARKYFKFIFTFIHNK